MEGLLHGMLDFFPIGNGSSSESDEAKLLVFQGVSGGFSSSGQPQSLFFIDPAWRLMYLLYLLACGVEVWSSPCWALCLFGRQPRRPPFWTPFLWLGFYFI